MADERKTHDTAEPSHPALANRAVAHCTRAWEEAYRDTLKTEDSEFQAREDAGQAFRAALPPLTTRDNCRDFIACVAQGMLLGAIDEKHGTKLLYAAQVALSVAGAEDKAKKTAAHAANPNHAETETRRLPKSMFARKGRS